MEALFDDLLPLPTGVRLVVGTQKIARQHLPSKLLQHHPEERWAELPAMSLSAVQKWLKSQDTAGRLSLDVGGFDTREEALRDVAGSFHEISGGLPLHLIYSFEALVRGGLPITRDDVHALPACPTGDISDYYLSIWNRVGPTAQAILHVLSGLRFRPPQFAITDCLGLGFGVLDALHSINHLLEYRETEVRAFHSSLYSFVRERGDHEATFAQHAPQVLRWIESDAPQYWRWAWLWITKAQLGDPSDLVAGPSRDWAIDALVLGYPIEQLITILDHSECAAFDAFDLPRFLFLRSLKTRAVNGLDYQTSDWPLFLEAAYSVTEDPYVHALLRDTISQTDTRIIPYPD